MVPSDFLNSDRIRCGARLTSKKRVIELMSSLLSSGVPGLTQARVYNALLERERLGSTGLGHGVAIPHGRMDSIDAACGAFIQLESGVDFDAIDNRRVDLVFGLIVPQQATEQHLQLLAQLASLFSDEQFCARLREECSPEGLIKEFSRQGRFRQSA